jgi:hypothetical protein
MSEPRYQTRVSDPDETTRIPKDALDALRDADQAQDGSAPAGHPTGSQPAAPVRPNGSGPGSTPAPRNGTPPSGPNSGATPSVRPDAPAGFRPSTNGSGAPSGPSGAPGMGLSGGPAGAPAGLGGLSGSPSGAPSGPSGSPPGSPSGATPAASETNGYRRSETGYSPAAYPNPGSYGSGFTSLSDVPTTVTAPGAATAGIGLGTGAASNTAAARSALGAATRPSSRQSGGARPARRARLLVRHIDPWSTLKFSFVLAVAMFFVWLVAIGVLYGVLDGMGVFDQINGLYDEVSGNGGNSLFSPGLVLGTAAIIGVINIVLFTALSTIGAFVYNICSDLVGGIEVTLAERD